MLTYISTNLCTYLPTVYLLPRCSPTRTYPPTCVRTYLQSTYCLARQAGYITDPLTYTVVTLVYFMYILPEDGLRSGPKNVVSSAQ
jgi:hypothetical protein